MSHAVLWLMREHPRSTGAALGDLAASWTTVRKVFGPAPAVALALVLARGNRVEGLRDQAWSEAKAAANLGFAAYDTADGTFSKSLVSATPSFSAWACSRA